MKDMKLFLTTLPMFLSFFINNAIAQEKDYSLARVGKKIQGVYIFIGTEPVNEYDYIGTVELRLTFDNESPDQQFERVISKAKKRYPNFDAMIFHRDNFTKADVVKFRGSEITGGGFRIGDKVTFKDNAFNVSGEIVSLDNSKQRATISYLDIYGDIKTDEQRYDKIRPIDQSQYDILLNKYKEEIAKYKYTIGQKASWIDGKEQKIGEIVFLDNAEHKAKIKYLNEYGEDKFKNVGFLDVLIISEEKYLTEREKLTIEISNHKFKIGEKVSWSEQNQQNFGEVGSLDDNSHKAKVKYFDLYGDEQLKAIDYLAINKISNDKYSEELGKFNEEVSKHKFIIGEKVLWLKTTLFNSNQTIINGEIISLDKPNNKASIKYIDEKGREKVSEVDFLKLTKTSAK